jgi:sulfur carrier protein
VKILLNGQERRLPGPMTVAALLADMGLAQRRVAVEINQEIVPRSRHAEMQLQEQDRVEIVNAIGGG